MPPKPPTPTPPGYYLVMATYLLEVVTNVKLVLLVRQLGLHLRVRVVDDGKEHVEEDEEDKEDVEDEVRGTEDTVRSFQLVEVEVSQDDSEQREPAGSGRKKILFLKR